MPPTHSIRSLQMPPRHHDPNGGGHNFPNAPPSPSLSTTTRASLDFPSRPAVLITRADLRTSLAAYEALLASAKAYTSAMLSMAKASSDLACALETCARVKGAHNSGPGLQAASGLHFLKSNYEQVLCDTFWKDFSIPLLSHYDTYRSACTDRQVLHDKAVTDKSKELKQAEARNNRAGRKKERDLNSFRRALAELQSHVDAIDELKAQYYNEVLDAEQEVWQFIESKVALIVRSQIEISERISSKGLNDPVLEQMLATIPDPFGSYGPAKQDGEIFSILPPISLLSSGANSLHNTSTEAATNDTSVTDADLTSEDARPTGTAAAANGSSKAKPVLPANIMSPSTPSKGLSRGISSSSSKTLAASATPTRPRSSSNSNTIDDLPSSSTPKGSRATNASSAGATPKARKSASCTLNGPTHLARDSLLGLSSVSEATTAISTSDGSPHTASGGLFGSESVDFEELLSREQLRRDASDNGDDADANADAETNPPSTATQDSEEPTATPDAANPTAAGRLRQVLSIIEEDASGPLSRAARMGTASRPVSSVYDAGPDPFADHIAEARRSASHHDSSKPATAAAATGDRDARGEDETLENNPSRSSIDDGASRHSRTPSKLSID
ncbi:related to IVY1 - phospholipid-binding protein [Ustilago trichophora]|uniref:Related to IVY1 - phospholipid-binding protein n=1 Tax=Ustilago trichophora TaxID=86804 RepID=A0A5C3EQ36_9BASI|nr:related to IVY1 - phospholipid-binding protein [Ustilago trichophora]